MKKYCDKEKLVSMFSVLIQLIKFKYQLVKNIIDCIVVEGLPDDLPLSFGHSLANWLPFVPSVLKRRGVYSLRFTKITIGFWMRTK